MLRFFAGTLLAQLAAMLIARSVMTTLSLETVLLCVFVAVLVAAVMSLWFTTISSQMAERRLSALKEQFARERESIQVSAERAQNKLLKKTQKEIASEQRKSRNRANMKVAVAVSVAAGFGLMMLFSQMVTLGMLTLTTAGGAVGGYLARSRRDGNSLPPADDYRVLEQTEPDDQQLLVHTSPQQSATEPPAAGEQPGEQISAPPAGPVVQAAGDPANVSPGGQAANS